MGFGSPPYLENTFSLGRFESQPLTETPTRSLEFLLPLKSFPGAVWRHGKTRGSQYCTTTQPAARKHQQVIPEALRLLCTSATYLTANMLPGDTCVVVQSMISFALRRTTTATRRKSDDITAFAFVFATLLRRHRPLLFGFVSCFLLLIFRGHMSMEQVVVVMGRKGALIAGFCTVGILWWWNLLVWFRMGLLSCHKGRVTAIIRWKGLAVIEN